MFHEAFHTANVCEEQTGPLRSIQKSLTFLGYSYVVTFSGDPWPVQQMMRIYRVVMLLCNTAHGWTISTSFLRNFTANFAIPAAAVSSVGKSER